VILEVLSFEEGVYCLINKEIKFRIYSRHKEVVNIEVNEKIVPVIKDGFPGLPSSITVRELDFFFKNDEGNVLFRNGKRYSLKKDKLLFNVSKEIQEFVLNRVFYMKDSDDIFIKKNIGNWKKIIGAGTGLTPKGDDFILGYSVFSKDSNFLSFFKNINFSKYTNKISTFFLENARKKRFSEIILNFISGKDNKLLSSGESSGIYTAFGIIEGWRRG